MSRWRRNLARLVLLNTGKWFIRWWNTAYNSIYIKFTYHCFIGSQIMWNILGCAFTCQVFFYFNCMVFFFYTSALLQLIHGKSVLSLTYLWNSRWLAQQSMEDVFFYSCCLSSLWSLVLMPHQRVLVLRKESVQNVIYCLALFHTIRWYVLWWTFRQQRTGGTQSVLQFGHQHQHCHNLCT